MLYLSKPNGNHGVFASVSSPGAYAVTRLIPGGTYTRGPVPGSAPGIEWLNNIPVHERDSLVVAKTLADRLDQQSTT